jgi:predicted porin
LKICIANLQGTLLSIDLIRFTGLIFKIKIIKTIEMKKFIFALASLSVASASYAQSTVTIYGLVDAAFQTKSTSGESSSQLQVGSGGLHVSRWGLRGSEDLSGGLKAIFQLESGFSVDTGAARGPNSLFSRVSMVGLTGGFGTVSAGLQWTPYDNGFLDALDYTGPSAMNSAFYKGAHGDNGNTDWGNAKNSIQYATPALGGFNATVMYAPGEDGTPVMSSSRYTGFGLKYAAGPFSAALAQETVTEKGTGAKINAWILTTSYDLKNVILFGAYERAKNETSNGGKDAGWSVGAAVPINSAMNFAASYARESTTQATGTTFNADNTALGSRLVYSLSKRTDVYGAYLKSEIIPTIGARSKVSTLSLGMQHRF